VVFIGLYIWRRINCIQCYAQILEKKVVNLKKENKELHGLLSCDKDGKCSMKEADILMNNIFMDDVTSVKKNCTTEIVKVTDVPKPVDVAVTQPASQPVTNSNVFDEIVASHASHASHADVADATDIESVISDAINNGIYNRKKLSKMNLDRLKDICNSLNISVDGTKNVLIDRILAQEQK
jgi:hypothetical protein